MILFCTNFSGVLIEYNATFSVSMNDMIYVFYIVGVNPVRCRGVSGI